MNILVLHGPNLNLLGEREPAIYGATTLARLDAMIRKEARALKAGVRVFQSNHEGGLIDLIHKHRRWLDALLINPGAYTHYSYALRDAIAAVAKPAAEVHLTDPKTREPWRRVSVVEDVCRFTVAGKGPEGYLEALRRLVAGT